MPDNDRKQARSITFQGRELTHDWLCELWKNAADQKQRRSERIRACQGMRRHTATIALADSWVQRHPEAAAWVVKVLPERNTLERDLIAGAGAVEPTYSRVALGPLDRDRDAAEECENYMEEWRKTNVPFPTFVEKGAEDGEYGLVVLPTSVDMDGCPDFYDRLDERAWNALDDERKAEYEPDDGDARGRRVRKNPDGTRAYNPTFDRDKAGRPRKPDDKGFERDDERSQEAHKQAVLRYLLKQEQGGVTVRMIPALDCAPYLVRGTRRERWRLHALVERTLYYPEELLENGYGWRGMGDRLLIPQGFDATRTTGQNGMWYLYTLYTVYVDPDDPDKVRRPIIAYSVGGQPTYHSQPRRGEDNGQGVAVIDLYEQFGLQGPFWWYGGGMHTSDDDADHYWTPYLWPFLSTLTTIEGITTSINAATAVQAFTGLFHRPDAALVGAEGVDPEALIDSSTNELRKPRMPAPGEIETVTGEVFPANPASVGRDAWQLVQNELQSLRENTTLERPAGGSASGHAQVVQETLAQTAKRHIREGALDATKFCGEAALRIFAAISKTYGVNWPLQTTKERPVGSEMRAGAAVLEFDPDWVGEGEYKLTAEYPEEGNLAAVEQEASLAERGFGSFEDVQKARGKSDAESEWAKVLKWRMRQQPAYIEALTTRLAKRQGNKLMLQVLKLQQAQQMTKQGVPGMDAGVATAALRRPGEMSGGGGGPTYAQTSRAGAISGEMGTAALMNDAEAQMQVGQGAA